MNLKQFFNLLKQQRLFSSIYIVCTALSMGLTMTLFLVLYIMFGPVYPEQKRNRMAVVKSVLYADGDSSRRWSAGQAGLPLADTLRHMPELEVVTQIMYGSKLDVFGEGDTRVSCMRQQVDHRYWQVFDFRFTHGRPFDATEWEARSPVCVISEGLARKLFGHTDAVGKIVKHDGVMGPEERHVVGVVEDVSRATPLTYAQLWTPEWHGDDSSWRGDRIYLGNYTLVGLLREGESLEALQTRVRSMEEKTNQELKAAGANPRLHLNDQPDPHWKSVFRQWGQVQLEPLVRKVLFLLTVFLFIPAMTMSSMVASRVNARTNELGIRRAYGATRAGLLWQVLQENFLLTLLGGLIGLLVSWVIVLTGSDWLPFLFTLERDDEIVEAVHIHADMMLSGWVMAAVMVACLVLNVVSALVPTMWILRKSVTEAINHKR